MATSTATSDDRITAASVVEGARFMRGDAEYEVDHVSGDEQTRGGTVIYARRIGSHVPPRSYDLFAGDSYERDAAYAMVYLSTVRREWTAA